MNPISNLQYNAAGAATSRSAEILYRIGYACHGVVHLIIGYLALALALGEGGRVTGPKGALATIGQQPFGKFMLLVLGLGMLGYVAWRFAQAFGNLDHEEKSWKSVAKRIGQAASGVIYLSFAYFAIRAFFTGAIGSDGGSSISAQILNYPGGSTILMAIGLVVAVTGIQQIYKGFTEKFLKETQQDAMTPEEEKVLRYSGKIGLPARGVTLVIVGYLLIRTGVEHRPRETGTKGALQLLMEQPYGGTVLAVVAAGFIAYAVYCFLAARHQRFVT